MTAPRSSLLNVGLALFVFESVVMGTLSFLLFSAFLVMEVWPDIGVVPEGVDQLGLLLQLGLAAVLGAGAYCGLMAVLHLRSLDVRRAFRWGLAASFLPPVQVLALVGSVCIAKSPEWKAAPARPRGPALARPPPRIPPR